MKTNTSYGGETYLLVLKLSLTRLEIFKAVEIAQACQALRSRVTHKQYSFKHKTQSFVCTVVLSFLHEM